MIASWDVVRFIGDKIAAILADDKDIADKAKQAISVEYISVPAEFSAIRSSKPGARLIHPEFPSYARVLPIDELSNVYGHMKHYIGNTESGREEADLIVEQKFITQRTHQGYLEPHGCQVSIDSETGNVKFLGEDGDNSSSWKNVGDANLVMATNKRVQQKGAFMQSSTNQSLTLGY